MIKLYTSSYILYIIVVAILAESAGREKKKGKGCGDAGRVETVNEPQNDPLAFYLTR